MRSRRARGAREVTAGSLAAAVLALAAGALPVGASDIRSTRHNLSVSGPGPVVAASETRVCVFCHTPHDADPVAPLWNRTESGASYTPYGSSSLDAGVGNPTGASKLCLSCHDGTVALGIVLSEDAPIAMAGGVVEMPPGSSGDLGADLSDDHPFSFEFTSAIAAADGGLLDPATLSGNVRLDTNGELQCTTCHDPHDDTFGDFLVQDNVFSSICQECHAPVSWDDGSHRVSTATWDGQGPDPWPHTDWTTVEENACESCHNPHGALGHDRLLDSTEEEAVCLVCHNGNVAESDLDTEFAKSSVHPLIDASGIHDPTETAPITLRHVECVDCHDPHAARPGGVADHLRGVDGIDGDGNPVDPAAAEYEVCYKCHADSPGIPDPSITRHVPERNLRLAFDPGNASFHPVESVGVNPDVPSLIAGWSVSDVMNCSDCHTNDEATPGGGSPPRGPHGSAWSPILADRYETADDTPSTTAAYALCYRCHSQASILGNESFDDHRLHIEEERAPCSACHDSHGVRPESGTGDHTHLINFDRSFVFPQPGTGVLEFLDNGRFRGECSLRCHGVTHHNYDY